jgi:hypothetical protein
MITNQNFEIKKILMHHLISISQDEAVKDIGSHLQYIEEKGQLFLKDFFNLMNEENFIIDK